MSSLSKDPVYRECIRRCAFKCDERFPFFCIRGIDWTEVGRWLDENPPIV